MNYKNILQNKKVRLAVIMFVVLVIGFFLGMEYKKYQIRSAIGDALSGMFTEDTEKPKIEEKKPQVVNDLTKKVTLEITKKGFIEGDFSDYNTFTLKLTNNTDKDIEGIKGFIVMNDLFGDQITGITLTYDKGILAGESKLYNASVDYNQFMDKDIKLKQTPLEKIKYEWSVQSIIYTDGSQENA